jgi:dipeptidyl aminopeptidase/acylaminoacyl peptidase
LFNASSIPRTVPGTPAARRAPGLAPESLSHSEPFAFVTPSGERLSGYITWPQSPTVAKPALLVWLHDGPWQRIEPGFQREAQALAAMGFAVAQIDYRGSAGHGRQWRESLRGRFDTAPLEDVQAAVAWLEERHTFDRKRVALVGEGYGGYLALRGLQRQPGAFRSAVSINAPVELGDLRRSLENERRIRRELEREVLGASPLQFL